jgi:hypothetical protein
VRLGNPTCDRKAQATAGSTARSVELYKSIEDPASVFDGDPGALIGHLNGDR